MPQVTIYFPDESAETSAAKKRLASDILSKHRLFLSEPHPNTTAPALRPFNMVFVSDPQTAKEIVAELQSNGISAFLKPRAFAP